MSGSMGRWSYVVRCFSAWCVLAPWPDYTKAEPLLTLSGCIMGSGCTQCPASRYTLAPDGSKLCCPGCASAALYHGDYPSKWCVCYSDSTSSGRAAAGNIDFRTLRFPGPSTFESRYPTGSSTLGSRYPTDPYTLGSRYPSSSSGAVGLFGSLQALPLRGSIRDANYILNHGDRPNMNPAVPLAVQQALTLMADTLEDLHIRVSRLENIILHKPDLQASGSVDRVGTASPPSEESCPAANFTRVGDTCYHFSVWRDQRSHWKDASDSCEGMGAKLAEPLTRTSFISLIQHLSLAATTTGFSYWIGGLYPGVSWRWSYAGKEVTLDPSYWMREDSMGRKVVPGGTATGRCLTLAYLVKASDYFYSADECGFEKYYICELLEKNHRRL